ncbi:Trm112 family protein [Nocardioides sp. TRM66260-LWL]|nr:Trm112 family protein [Nocardioides sp. TRM66260-LWL]MBZ5734208.1 Trm112 family protein [Nocardioides sp. TRM66260-LWL]
MPSLDPALAAVIACPACAGSLAEQPAASGEGIELACTGCGLVYPVVDDIPVLLVDEARRP